MKQMSTSLIPTKNSPLLSISDLKADQNEIIDRLYERNTLLVAQAGVGKTVCAQTAMQELIEDGVLKRIIVFAPLKVCQLTWAVEHEKWDHLKPVTMATGDHVSRDWAVLNASNTLVVMNLDNLGWFFRNYGHLKGLFDGLLIDEISKLKDPGSTSFKSMRKHIKNFKWRCGMSATPVHEAVEDLYPQMMIVDDGAALGKNKEKFLRKYFMQMDYRGYKWELQPGGLEKLSAAIEDTVFVANTADYEASLPELKDIIVPVEMPPSAWEVYDDMLNTQVSSVDGEDITAANLAVMQGKLQQVCCGAVYDEEKNTRWVHHEKMRVLDEAVMGFLAPLIIVYQFAYELNHLRTLYPEALVLGDDPVGCEKAWNDGLCPILLVHPKSASHGLNLQYGGCIEIWLSPVWSADQWDQCIRRIRRRGQPSDTVYRYILLVENSVEQLILNRHTIKTDNAEAFVAHVRERQNASKM